MPDKNSNRLDDLSQKLYSPNSPDIVNKKIRPLSPLASDVPHAWQDTTLSEDTEFEEPPKKGKGAWLFFVIAFIFALASFGFAWFYIVNKGDVASKIHITVTGPVSTPAGREYPLDIRIANTNSFPLEVVDLVIEYPPGTKRADVPDQDIGTYREGLGTIESGQTVDRTISAVLFGESQQHQNIIVRIEYRIPNSNAILDKEKSIDVLIESGPVEFTLETLNESIAGQETTLTLRVRSNTDAPITDMLIQAEYPQGFSFISASPEATYDNNGWRISVLEPRQMQTIVIRGVFNGDENTDRYVRFTAGVPDQFDNKKISNIYASSLEKVTIVKPFLSARLIFREGEVVQAGDTVKGVIEWENNSGGTLTDIGVELMLSGTALDKKMVNANGGYFKSTDNKIIWNKTTDASLTKLDAGDTGKVEFELGTFEFREYASLIKNPEINLDVSLSARRPMQTGVPEEIRSTVTKKVKVATNLGFAGKSVYYIGPFANTGPVPPRVETDTTYTIVWTLTNTSNDVSNAQVSAYLPPYMKWNNKISPSSDKVIFDETTRKITWSPGTVSAGTGYTRPSREVAFQVTLFASTNMEGSIPALVNNIQYSGKDSFTGVDISKIYDKELSTRMINDPNFVSAMEKVGGE